MIDIFALSLSHGLILLALLRLLGRADLDRETYEGPSAPEIEPAPAPKRGRRWSRRAEPEPSE